MLYSTHWPQLFLRSPWLLATCFAPVSTTKTSSGWALPSPPHIDQLYVSFGPSVFCRVVAPWAILLLQRHWDTMRPRRAGKLIPHAGNPDQWETEAADQLLLPSSSLLHGLYHEAVLLTQDILRQSNKTEQLVMTKQAVAGLCTIPSISAPLLLFAFFFSPVPGTLLPGNSST